ncbi:97 kDa heat shock protein [Diaphorina citri]|uniref:97 kDa heat shock protein n=1 Tax=Diaphorina citri TaxID=121845 RepID=A0A3Q0IS59_DIACI|nr:97 kDa heat shock protein [Diaphorina citri]KAI5695110.1 hypothetical protein M8J75_011130 [Diaphorina citri]KAI5716151.1 hypothetical protein M8J76_001723 [Diaphorina citri]
MSVIGIDFGTESCYLSVAKSGGIETIVNDYSLRSTPSCVAFSDKNRILGVAAKNQTVTNVKNTIFGFKRLLGRTYDDPFVQEELKSMPFQSLKQNDGSIGIKVNYLNKEHVFSPEQLTAMLFTKLKDISENEIQNKVHDCVLAVPSYFTNNERKALLTAASIAGLNVLRLINETTATALAYGIYKQDLPEDDQNPRYVAFVDFGYSALQVCIAAFVKGKLKVLSNVCDSEIGGRNIDKILAEYISTDFVKRYKIDPRTNARAYIRLLSEIEKLKKQMSANSNKLPLNIECFMDDKDVHAELKRNDLETLCEHIFGRIEICLNKCIAESKLPVNAIHSIEIVGGSSRIPAFKNVIESVFHKPPSTTLNQDEAVSRGCALQCAILSPAVKIRHFDVTDVQNYPIKVAWNPVGGEDGENLAFSSTQPVPFTKVLTFYRANVFDVQAYYDCPVPYPTQFVGQFIIKDIKPGPKGKPQKVKVKMTVNVHGVFSVTSASMFEDLEDQKEMFKCDLPYDSVFNHYLANIKVHDLFELECKMQDNDRQEKDRVDAKNALEEYVYELRDGLANDKADFITDSNRNVLNKKLDETENWLYEEGQDVNRSVYNDRLNSLRTVGDPVKMRAMEYAMRPNILEEYKHSVQSAKNIVDAAFKGDDRFSHLSKQDLSTVETAIKQHVKWIEEKVSKLKSLPKHENPPITCDQIREEKYKFEKSVWSVLNKPKPAPPAPNSTTPSEQSSEENVQQQNMETD